MAKKEKAKESTTERDDTNNKDSSSNAAVEMAVPVTKATPSMTVSLFVTWIIPIIVIAIIARFGVDTEPPAVKVPPNSRPINIDLQNTNLKKKNTSGNSKVSSSNNKAKTMMSGSMMMTTGMNNNKAPSPTPSPQSNHPTNYQALLDDIAMRKRLWKPKNNNRDGAASSRRTNAAQSTSSRSAGGSRQNNPKATKQRDPSKDPNRAKLDDLIERSREVYKEDPNDVFKASKLADLLRQKDVMYHDGGLGQQESLQAYQHAINSTLKRKTKMLEDGEPTNLSLSGTRNVPEEVFFDYSQKSVDGLLCALYTNMGKVYFMANMFERAVQSYTHCIEIEKMYLDAVGSRGSSNIILGKYAEAGHDLQHVIDNDQQHFFNDAFTGMAKILVAKEEVVPQGWEPMIEALEKLIVYYEAAFNDPQQKRRVAEALNRLHHVMFTYHDFKTKNRNEAWKHLTLSYKHKMSVLEPYNEMLESQKLMTVKTVFHKNFWPGTIGSQTDVPIFIIGFVRSGSTLLERVLDAHPQIVGTGEDSVFNGRLDHIRNSIVQSSIGGDMIELKEVVADLADSVVNDMRERWKKIDANTSSEGGNQQQSSSSNEEPLRFTDKMLTNYFNVGFIHMLFPNALILHVARNPMDVIWSAYKHEFPPGGLDYTSEFKSLANMYHAYREVIRHWDDVLPGRITHVRYEDLVNDMPGVARGVITATGLEWNDSVLDFHKKKQAVNTLSTTQVRKGIYRSGMNAWKKYETQLEPLAKLIGDEVQWNLKSSFPTI